MTLSEFLVKRLSARFIETVDAISFTLIILSAALFISTLKWV